MNTIALNHLLESRTHSVEEHPSGYDENGNLKSVMDARQAATNQKKTIYEFDSLTNRLVRRTDPLGRTETFDLYDPLGNLRLFTDRRGKATEFVYDGFQRRQVATFGMTGPSTHESEIVYAYDLGNRLRQVTDSLSGGSTTTITRTYDDLDRLTSETTPEGSISYTYEGDRRRTMTVAGQPQVCYDYDGAHRLTGIRLGGCGAAQVISIALDAAGRRESVTLPNGVITQYTYTPLGSVATIVYKQADGTVLGDLSYAYDASGKRIGIGGAWARTGLPMAQGLLSYDDANERSGTGIGYDANGNLLGDGVNTYGWNARNQLATISGSEISASFAYDGLGRRSHRVVNDSSTTFRWDGYNRAATVTGPTTSLMLSGFALDEHFTRIDGTMSSSFLTDALGSIVALTDGAGMLVASYQYDPYGAGALFSGSPGTDLQFTGRENDGTGLYYHRARYYAPTWGRFAAEDPLGFIGGDMNLYAYAEGSPIMLTDRSGLATYACKKPLDVVPGTGARSGPDVRGNPLYHEWLCTVRGGRTQCGEQNRTPELERIPGFGPGQDTRPGFDPNKCEMAEPDSWCMEHCVEGQFRLPRPLYGAVGPGTNCQEWAQTQLLNCRIQCGL